VAAPLYRLAVAVVIAAVSVMATPAAAATAVPGQLVVGFKKGSGDSARQQIVERAGGRLVSRLWHIRAAVVQPRHGVALKLLIRRLRTRSGVVYAERDFYLNASRVPNDPLYAQQYALGETGSGSVDAPDAWDSRTNCSKVAVLDTGIQSSHPDLGPNMWHNPDEVKSNGKDDDKNGWVDDYYGVNLVTGKGSGTDDNGHGSHAAGIIAGDVNNATGIAGLCWSSQLMAVKFMKKDGTGATSNAVKGIDYAVREGARIINCSFGSSEKSKALEDEIKYAKSKNTLVVVAAGNDGRNIDSKPSYPAAYTEANILSVAASTAKGGLASFSNYGKSSVDLGAPGDKIISTWIGSTYRTVSGTSMAAPLVAAAAAMVAAKKSNETYTDLKNALTKHIHKVSALKGKTVTGGVLDIEAALG
jgi:thermitase